MEAYGYVRVSGRSQVVGLGFDRQEEVISAYAGSHGYEVVKVFREEGVSGTTDEVERPAFRDMIAAMLFNGVRTVIIERLDRLAREFRVQEALLIYLASKDVTLISAATEENITESVRSDPMRKAIIQIQGIFAELEKSLLVKKLKAARDKVRLEKGKCGGARGYGEVLPGVVERVRALRLLGVTFPLIAERLNYEGHKTAKGQPFTGQICQNVLRKRPATDK